MELTNDPPTNLTPLTSFQSQTPTSFQTPVLYHRSDSTTLSLDSRELPHANALGEFVRRATPQAQLNGHKPSESPGDSSTDEGSGIAVRGVDIYITSENLTLFHSSSSTGLRIPHPSITLHAIQPPTPSNTSASILLHILTPASARDEEEEEEDQEEITPTITLNIHPVSTTNAPSDPDSPSQPPSMAQEVTTAEGAETQAIYTALTSTAELFPDPGALDDGEDGPLGPSIMSVDQDAQMIYGDQDGLPPPMPGSGGWITADNAHLFFDEGGNFRQNVVHAGAGSVTVGDGVGGDENEVGSSEGQAHEGGYEGLGDGSMDSDEEGRGETKWRRTG